MSIQRPVGCCARVPRGERQHATLAAIGYHILSMRGDKKLWIEDVTSTVHGYRTLSEGIKLAVQAFALLVERFTWRLAAYFLSSLSAFGPRVAQLVEQRTASPRRRTEPR